MKAELEELADIARGASEREIETEVVHILKGAGWPRSQINQDVPISDKGADKADIVLKLDNLPVILVEVKRYGHSRDADNQVNRYCRLLRPSPKLALLTDGVRWVLYYVGQVGAIPILDATVPSETISIVSMLTAFNPASFSSLLHAGVFQYLDVVEQGLQGRSEDTQKHLRSFFAATVKALLMPDAIENGNHVPVLGTPRAQSVQSTESHEPAIASQKQSPHQENGIQTEYDPFRPPSLAFTSILTARFAGDTAMNWNDLLHIAVRNALGAGQTKHEIQRMTSINIQDGAVTNGGYSPLQNTDLSVQSLSASDCWCNAFKLAQNLGCLIELTFRWKDNEKASHPGKNGMLRWHP